MFDAAIIGGGLAGTMAASVLARAGQRVLLLEAGTYPRARVCGEFLSPEARPLLRNISFTAQLDALRPVQIDTVGITSRYGSPWRAPLPAPGMGVSRYALDAALADHAAGCGAELHTQTRVTGLTGDLTHGFNLTAQTPTGARTFNSRVVIGAYGKHGGLDRVFARPAVASGSAYVGLKQHLRGPQMGAHLELFVFPGGYVGVSMVEDGTANISLIVRQTVFQRVSAAGGIEAFIAWMRAQNPALDTVMRGAETVYPAWLSIAQVTVQPKRALEGDVLLAGDAAGMIAPLAGDGMAMALHAGWLSAEAALPFLTRTQTADQMKQTYTHAWKQTFNPRLLLARGLHQLMIRPRLIAPGLSLLNLLPPLGQALVTYTRDLQLVETSSC